MDEEKKDLSAFGIEDLEFFMRFAPRAKLEAESITLSKDEVSIQEMIVDLQGKLADYQGRLKKVQMRRDAIIHFLDANPPNPEGDEPTPLDEPGKQESSLPTSSLSVPDAPTEMVTTVEGEEGQGKQDHGTGKQPRNRKDRGTLEERNAFLLKLIKEEDNWLFRTEFEKPLIMKGWLDSDEDPKEVVRGFLRQAESVLAHKTVFTITSTNKVATARMYGLPEFLAPENETEYNFKLAAKLPELNMYMTEEEGIRARNAKVHGGQMQLTPP